MVWKDSKKPEKAKKSVKKKTSVLFANSKTRTGTEMNVQKGCKITTNKKLTRSQSTYYNNILDDQKFKDDPKAKSHKQKSKK